MIDEPFNWIDVWFIVQLIFIIALILWTQYVDKESKPPNH